jgi:ABC-type multidrug transport system fused ATPase/permease subunit
MDMPPKQRQIRMQQTGGLQAMQQLETRSDEELEREQKFKAAAQAILGARAAERYDAKASREHFRKALAAARPQERMALRRMADASLALAERRPDDLKAAVERLGQEAPSSRQLMLLRFMGLVAPPKSAGTPARVRGIAIVVGLIVALVVIGTLIAKVVALPFGGVSTLVAVWLGILIIIVVLVVLALLGRRRQARARASRGT